MKKFILMLVLLVSYNSFAGQLVKEFDQSQEMACNSEMAAQGCVTADGAEDTACVDKKLSKLSKNCQSMHKEKKKN